MENKSQHYVPRFYLRQFSGDKTDRVLVCLVSPYRCVGRGSIAGQCKGDFFYGKASPTDAMLTDVEKAIAPTLYDLNANRKLTEQNLEALRLLAVQLHLRTKKAAEIAKTFPRLVADQVITAGIKRGELPPPPDGKWGPEMMDFEGVPQSLLATSLLPSYFETKTLRCKLLVAPLGTFFVTSDHPTVALNQFAADAKSVRSFVGFAQAGFQLVLPLGPSLCAFFYDPSVYKVGNRHEQIVEISADEVSTLNALQVQSAEKCLYAHAPEAEPAISQLVSKYAKLRKSNETVLKHYPQNERETLIMVGTPEIKIPSRWHFCSYLKNTKHTVGDRRDPGYTFLIQKLMDDIENIRDGADLETRLNRVEASLSATEPIMIRRRAALPNVHLPANAADWKTGYPK